MPFAIIVAGPTSSKKSDTALALAEKLGTEIINADSMQVYQGFDIGTAKAPAEVRARVKHHLVDILAPDEEFNAFDFKTRALEIIRDLLKQNRIPVLAGGTGLYLKALTEDFECAVPISREVKAQMQTRLRERGVRAMHEDLERIDPAYARKIQATDTLRIQRALSVYLQTGKPFSTFHAEESPPQHEFDIYPFLLQWDRQALYANIDRRVDAMIEQGLVDEVQHLLGKGYSKTLKPFQSIGYSQIVNHLEGTLTLERAIYEIKRETRHFAKRQITWFKKVPNTISIPAGPQDTAITLRDKILRFLPQAVCGLLLGMLCLGFSVPAQAGKTETLNHGIQHLRKGNLSKAHNRFLALHNGHPDSAEGARALVLLAHLYALQKDYAKAIEYFEKALKRRPAIEDYLRFELARAYFHHGQNSRALEQVETLLEKFPQTLTYPEAALLRVRVLESQGRTPEAVTRLEETIGKISRQRFHRFEPHLPEMKVKLAGLYQETGRTEEAYALYRELSIDHPNHDVMERVQPGMKRLAARPEIDPRPWTEPELDRRIRQLLKGVRYREVIDEIRAFERDQDPLPGRFHFYLAQAYKGLRQRQRAIEVLQRFLKLYPRHARVPEARFRIGRNLWNLNRDAEAVTYFESVLKKNESSGWGLKTGFILGRLHEGNKNYQAALDHYSPLVSQYGNADYAQGAAWRMGWIHFLTGKYQEAYRQFEENIRRYPEGLFIETNLYWKAKTAQALGKTRTARTLFRDVFERYPYTYYGVRARKKLIALGAWNAESEPRPRIRKVRLEWKEEGPVRLNRALTRAERFHHTRARELSALGFYEPAQQEIQELEKSVRKTLTGVLWLAQLYQRARSYSDSVRLLQLYRDYRSKENEKDLSHKFWRFFFPLAYADIIQSKSSKHDIDPYFVKGLIRQESLFDTGSLSPAGARGLMQIMPETGKKLYSQEAGGKPFELEDLHDPGFNIHLGIKYLGQLKQRFGNNGTYTLISYNAGPHVLKKWLIRFKDLDDEDVFIESIPYPETRRYVKHVLRNYGIYKMLYPVPESRASLPN